MRRSSWAQWAGEPDLKLRTTCCELFSCEWTLLSTWMYFLVPFVSGIKCLCTGKQKLGRKGPKCLKSQTQALPGGIEQSPSSTGENTGLTVGVLWLNRIAYQRQGPVVMFKGRGRGSRKDNDKRCNGNGNVIGTAICHRPGVCRVNVPSAPGVGCACACGLLIGAATTCCCCCFASAI